MCHQNFILIQFWLSHWGLIYANALNHLFSNYFLHFQMKCMLVLLNFFSNIVDVYFEKFSSLFYVYVLCRCFVVLRAKCSMLQKCHFVKLVYYFRSVLKFTHSGTSTIHIFLGQGFFIMTVATYLQQQSPHGFHQWIFIS